MFPNSLILPLLGDDRRRLYKSSTTAFMPGSKFPLPLKLSNAARSFCASPLDARGLLFAPLVTKERLDTTALHLGLVHLPCWLG